jgi:hypothetical protein
MSAYSEYLRSLGASDADVAVLDTPLAQKAFTQLNSDKDAAVKTWTDYKANADKWYADEVIPKFTEMQQKTALAEAERARAVALIQSATDAGMIELAKKAGFDKEIDDARRPKEPSMDDKYVSRDLLLQVAEKEGDAIAIAQDIAYEHAKLFPDKTLSFQTLRREAISRKVPVMQVWEEKYGVPAARAARETADRTAYETKLREEGAAAERTKFASTYGNPDARPLTSSSNPFVNRSTEKKEKQPWEVDENSRTADRVRMGAQKAIERGVN